jgi:glutathione S-transferase
VGSRQPGAGVRTISLCRRDQSHASGRVKAPVLTNHDGPGGKPYTLFESGGIRLHLAEKTGKALPTDAGGRFGAIQWMMVHKTLGGAMFGQYLHFMRFAPEGSADALDRYRTPRPWMRTYAVRCLGAGEAVAQQVG